MFPGIDCNGAVLSTTLWIGNLDMTAREEELRAFVGRHGQIATLQVQHTRVAWALELTRHSL